MTYVSEKYQLSFVRDYFTAQGVEIETEIELFSIPIDVVGLKSNDDIITVELKSKDVKRGLSQAQRNLEWADYSYLAVWDSNISEDVIDRLDNTEIGLCSVNSGLHIKSPANRNEPHPYPNDELRNKIQHEL